MACDVFSLPFKDRSFDCIYSQGLMEHFDETKVTVILREMRRVAEYVVFSVPLHTYRGNHWSLSIIGKLKSGWRSSQLFFDSGLFFLTLRERKQFSWQATSNFPKSSDSERWKYSRTPSPPLWIDLARTYGESHLPSWLFKDVADRYAMFL